MSRAQQLKVWVSGEVAWVQARTAGYQVTRDERNVTQSESRQGQGVVPKPGPTKSVNDQHGPDALWCAASCHVKK